MAKYSTVDRCTAGCTPASDNGGRTPCKLPVHRPTCLQKIRNHCQSPDQPHCGQCKQVCASALLRRCMERRLGANQLPSGADCHTPDLCRLSLPTCDHAGSHPCSKQPGCEHQRPGAGAGPGVVRAGSPLPQEREQPPAGAAARCSFRTFWARRGSVCAAPRRLTSAREVFPAASCAAGRRWPDAARRLPLLPPPPPPSAALCNPLHSSLPAAGGGPL